MYNIIIYVDSKQGAHSVPMKQGVMQNFPISSILLNLYLDFTLVSRSIVWVWIREENIQSLICWWLGSSVVSWHEDGVAFVVPNRLFTILKSNRKTKVKALCK